MFPNDDICNVDMAKEAAKRLFSRYGEGKEKEKAGLGKK